MKVLFDTGSDASYLMSDKCKEDKCGKKPKYQGRLSRTYHELKDGEFNNEFSISQLLNKLNIVKQMFNNQ